MLMKHVLKLLNLSELQFISGNDGHNQFTQFRKFLWGKGNTDNYLEQCASSFRLQARYPQHCINVSGLQFLICEGGSPHVPFQRRSLSVALCQVISKCSAFLSVLCVRGSRGRSCSERFNGLALPFTVRLAGDYTEGSRCLWSIHRLIQNESPREKHRSGKTPGVLRYRPGICCSQREQLRVASSRSPRQQDQVHIYISRMHSGEGWLFKYLRHNPA